MGVKGSQVGVKGSQVGVRYIGADINTWGGLVIV